MRRVFGKYGIPTYFKATNTLRQLSVKPVFVGEYPRFFFQYAQQGNFFMTICIDPNQSRDFHPAVLLIWWANKWWSVMYETALKPCYYHLSTTKACILQWLSIADCNHRKKQYIDSGKYNVSLEQMFTTLAIIYLVAARVLAIQILRYRGIKCFYFYVGRKHSNTSNKIQMVWKRSKGGHKHQSPEPKPQERWREVKVATSMGLIAYSKDKKWHCVRSPNVLQPTPGWGSL